VPTSARGQTQHGSLASRRLQRQLEAMRLSRQEESALLQGGSNSSFTATPPPPTRSLPRTPVEQQRDYIVQLRSRSPGSALAATTSAAPDQLQQQQLQPGGARFGGTSAQNRANIAANATVAAAASGKKPASSGRPTTGPAPNNMTVVVTEGGLRPLEAVTVTRARPIATAGGAAESPALPVDAAGAEGAAVGPRGVQQLRTFQSLRRELDAMKGAAVGRRGGILRTPVLCPSGTCTSAVEGSQMAASGAVLSGADDGVVDVGYCGVALPDRAAITEHLAAVLASTSNRAARAQSAPRSSIASATVSAAPAIGTGGTSEPCSPAIASAFHLQQQHTTRTACGAATRTLACNPSAADIPPLDATVSPAPPSARPLTASGAFRSSSKVARSPGPSRLPPQTLSQPDPPPADIPLEGPSVPAPAPHPSHPAVVTPGRSAKKPARPAGTTSFGPAAPPPLPPAAPLPSLLLGTTPQAVLGNAVIVAQCRQQLDAIRSGTPPLAVCEQPQLGDTERMALRASLCVV